MISEEGHNWYKPFWINHNLFRNNLGFVASEREDKKHHNGLS